MANRYDNDTSMSKSILYLDENTVFHCVKSVTSRIKLVCWEFICLFTFKKKNMYLGLNI